MSTTRDTRDIAAGLVFVAVGVVVYVLALDYPFGRTARLGPGYFPQALAMGLGGLGLLIAVRGALRRIDTRDASPIPWIEMGIVATILGVPAALALGFGVSVRGGLIVGAAAAAGLAFALGRREFALLLAPLIVVSLAFETIGLLVGSILIVGLSGLAAHDARLKEVGISAILLAIFAVCVFALGLGIPVPIWPSF